MFELMVECCTFLLTYIFYWLILYVLPVIYHYAVIVEMFCICLFARNTFRKVEPSPEQGDRGDDWQDKEDKQDKAVQTEEELSLSVQLSAPAEAQWSGWCGGGGSGGGASNPGYNSDSEDSLCRIEHAPLDRFPFPLHPRRQEDASEDKANSESTGDCLALELSKVTVTAEINYDEKPDVTVV